jgi:hypothetical protein
VIKKVELHVDAIAVIVLVFVASFGFNLYQRYQYSDLMEEHVELQWRAQDTEINWKYVKGLLEICRGSGRSESGAAAGTE